MWINIAVPAESVEELQESLDFLTRISERQIRRHGIAHPYVAGIVYKREPPGRERWQTALETIKRGDGDCEDLAAYLAAWLRVHGTPQARAMLRPSSVGYHAIVVTPGAVLDPSKQLGMKGES